MMHTFAEDQTKRRTKSGDKGKNSMQVTQDIQGLTL